MKIVAISDTHNRHWELPELPLGDILIHAGDASNRGSKKELDNFIIWLKLQAVKYEHVIFIAGNHDFGMDRGRILYSELPDNVYYLQDSGVEIEGIKFWGTPWTPIFKDWAYMLSELELSERFAEIPEETQVLISHGPPDTILDKNSSGDYCGSESLFNRVKQLPNLKICVFGHIHEAYGHEKIANVDFYNLSILNQRYLIQNPPTVLVI